MQTSPPSVAPLHGLSGADPIRSDWHAGLAIFVIWVAMSGLVGVVGNFPLNDDWVYALAVQSLLETGRYQFPSATSANVGPQLFWGALFCLPFGFSFTALRLSSLVIGFVGVVSLYAIVKRLCGSRGTALLAALVLAVNPLYFSLANGFMTDVPFIALTLVAVNLLMLWLERDSHAGLAGGLVAVSAAILVRQFAVVVVVAFVVADVVKRGASVTRLVRGVALIALAGALHFGYQRWLVVTGRTPLLSIHADVNTLVPSSGNAFSMLKMATSALLYTGLFVLPFVARFTGTSAGGLLHPRPARRVWLGLVCGAAACAVFAVLWRIGKLMPASGNVLIPSGIGPRTLFDTYILHVNLPAIPIALSGAWAALTLLAILGAMRAAHLIGGQLRHAVVTARRTRRWQHLWAPAFVVALGLAYFFILVIVTGHVYVFDRYFLLLLPVTLMLLAGVRDPPLAGLPRQIGFALPAVLLVLYAAFSVATVHDYLSWNRSRWLALHDLTGRGGVHPNEVDGGYEFNGWLLYDPKYQEQAGKSWWWVQDNKYVIASGLLPGYSQIASHDVPRWLPFGDDRILTLKRMAPLPARP